MTGQVLKSAVRVKKSFNREECYAVPGTTRTHSYEQGRKKEETSLMFASLFNRFPMTAHTRDDAFVPVQLTTLKQLC